MFEDLLKNPSDDVIRDLTYFNVPVCDLDKLGDFGPGKCTKGYAYDEDVILVFSQECIKSKIGDSEWPYKWN